jgi:hypothetical protein
VASPHGVQPRDNVPRTPSHYDSPANERRKDYRLFPENEEDDSPEKSAQSVRPPRHDSIQQAAQAAGPKYASVGVDSQRGSGAVPIRQAHGIGQDHYQETPESQYRSLSQQRAETEARHKPEVLQARHPLLPSQPPYLDPNRSEQSYAGSYPASTTYLPGHPKSESDFRDFRDWQEYRRLRDEYERERPTEPPRAPASKYDEGYETPPPGYSEAEPRQHKPRQASPDRYSKAEPQQRKPRQSSPGRYSEAEPRQLKPRQPSPGTYGQKRGHQQGSDQYAPRRSGYYR